jgi:hypothetical protein
MVAARSRGALASACNSDRRASRHARQLCVCMCVCGALRLCPGLLVCWCCLPMLGLGAGGCQGHTGLSTEPRATARRDVIWRARETIQLVLCSRRCVCARAKLHERRVIVSTECTATRGVRLATHTFVTL